MTAILSLFPEPEQELRPIKVRKPTKQWLMIQEFSAIWSESYMGEAYEASPKDYKFAKMFLDTRDGEFDPEMIRSRARVYLSMDGFYADNRHSFTAFINNIGSFVPKPSMQQKVTWTQGKKKTCPKCGLEYRAKEGHECYLMGTRIEPE